MRAYAVAGFVLLLAAAVCGCAPAKEASTAAPAAEAKMPALSGTYWKIDEAGGQKVASPEGARTVFIQFDETAKRVTGFSGCNTFNGGYEAKDGTLKLGPLISTRMACIGDADKIEFAVLQAFGNVAGYAIKDSVLTFTDANGAVVLRASVGKP